jgi:hypothetical protein
MDEIRLRSANSEAERSYQAILARMVVAVSQDHAQLRALIYDFARTKLRKDLYRQFEEVGWTGIATQVLALEAAIDRVEADCANNDLLPPLKTDAASNRDGQLSHTDLDSHTDLASRTDLTPGTDLVPSADVGTSLILDDRVSYEPPLFLAPTMKTVTYAWPTPSAAEREGRSWREGRRSGLTFWWNIQLLAAVIIGILIYAALDGQSALALLRLHRLDGLSNTNSGNTNRRDTNVSAEASAPTARPKTVSLPGIPNVALPSAYGVYAVSDGKLTELDLLPIKVPDPRVAISTLISTPSRAHLPIGQLQFVVFRRDIVNDAPDRVAMRVVARVKRALTFDAQGKPSVTNLDAAWVVRSNSYQMSVAPVPDNPEMIVIRPDHPVVFPAGRYALVLKGAAYDFTLDGPNTDMAHCLERTDALNAPIYTECRDL